MSKNLVVCCDGTWNTADQHIGGVPCPTNVIKIARSIAPTGPNGSHQVVYYGQGVGTRRGLDKLIGGAFGIGLSGGVQEAYRFIVHNYNPGDRLYIFGFSRGAYTARSLCGLIRKCGILRKHESDRIPEAYVFYRNRGVHPDDDSAVRFREMYARDVAVEFLGVWDTVGALGIPHSRIGRLFSHRHEFHDVQLSRIVRNAFHALAIDEHRRAFEPTLWTTKPSSDQRVQQVWFAGAHSDVGGGYAQAGLSDLAFIWMKERAEECGLAFDPEFIRERIDPDSMGVLHESRTGIYKLRKAFLRRIGQGVHTNEAVHPAAVHRYQTEAAQYRPTNLGMFLAGSKLAIANIRREQEAGQSTAPLVDVVD